ncbi:MAG: integrase [Hydrogenophilales bacterium CG17_big_fil_post_rev_8_21_14_2_50_63_12]|nr:MAG: integrase [Hydrogenophilales bacterium CG17_big_fil_post_rev_8_21_14_2_50_63_12]PIX96054.1 MAG: integrase [Hydrogenophilales bacterium CG_4_10_14_3_um_filter_63_21]
MLSDGTLRGLKPEVTAYKVADRDGMYVTVSPKGTITFRLDYRLNGRRETLTVGRYGTKDGISLLMARERCMEARRAIAAGQSPSQEKQREKRRAAEAKTFEEFTKRWLEEARMADSTKSMRKSIIDRDIMPAFRNRLLAEIGPEDLRNLCAKVKDRGAPATAIHIRDIVKQVFSFAALHGDKAPNPADEVGPSSIATFVPKDRALSPSEIRVMHRVLETTATLPTIRLALRLILLTLVRKSELIEATWNEVDFEKGVWSIPKSRMKAGKPHNVYLSTQAMDIMVALRTCAGGSRYILPSRYDADRCMSKATLNRVTQVVVAKAKESGLPLESFTVHDLRRTGSTILNELGFNSDWIEKALAHEDGRSSRGVYNKAEYGEQRRHMLQEWADMIDAWVAGESHTPTLLPPSMKMVTTAAPI